MILITGGLGFIGTHTTRALLDLGESCVLVQRRPAEVPAGFAAEAGERLFVEQADVTDEGALSAIGDRYEITGILHLAGSMPWPVGAYEPVEHTERALRGLLNLFRAARDWQVRRLGLASTIGVYAGVTADGPLREDLPLTMDAPHPIPRFKKIGELLAGHLDEVLGVETVSYRIGGIWGPLGHNPDPFFPAPQLVHAAARGTEPDLSALMTEARAGSGIDVCYVKDCGRALALLQTAGRLRHRTYNVASGRITTNGELIEAIRQHVPGARVELPEGRAPGPVDHPLDITRLREDTGFEPAYDTGRAVAEYVDWLRAGHER
ncbi:NAD-dependent epimerase/dehydratase family protein [Nonomuraea gerenzanensis]|uniref:UDP-glucose 4-epimerase n=1 Tax=Nonomuraea gerenzanensis TaxID=93944 RepID=A0A1M4EH25_9ACTN|nr:NAD(P)-dependent oxidoreductase [Nonomuraea gerenzanensis]UBU09633.1 NAD(P)-dependent oxidoreductase [Nonomuraea gerenzanensis]SBO98064.1 UDP-glucose 4-epimerase [Nonomuraea gerenzanensis]